MTPEMIQEIRDRNKALGKYTADREGEFMDALVWRRQTIDYLLDVIIKAQNGNGW